MLTIAEGMTGFGLLCCFSGGEVKDKGRRHELRVLLDSVAISSKKRDQSCGSTCSKRTLLWETIPLRAQSHFCLREGAEELLCGKHRTGEVETGQSCSGPYRAV